jgi:hypothetical protein
MLTEKQQLQKARITAFLLGSFTVIALIALLFAISQQKQRAKLEASLIKEKQENAAKLEMLQKELEACRQSK